MKRPGKNLLCLGIDPGANGAIVRWGPSFLVDSPTSYHLTIKKLADQVHLSDVWEWIDQVRDDAAEEEWQVVATLERVGGFIGTDASEGGKRNKAAAHQMFNFGRGYGHLEAFLTAAGIEFHSPTPQQWTKALGIPPRDSRAETRTSWKNRLKARAIELFPGQKITLDVADAFLLAEYSRVVSKAAGKMTV